MGKEKIYCETCYYYKLLWNTFMLYLYKDCMFYKYEVNTLEVKIRETECEKLNKNNDCKNYKKGE